MIRTFSLAVFLAATLAPGAGGGERVVAYRIVDARSIPDPLGGVTGDPAAGRAIYFDGELAGCAGCHGDPEGEPGKGAPSLAGLAGRMEAGRLRLWLVAPRVLDPETTMPGYYTVGQRTEPMDPRFGETRLSASEIESLIAYLLGPAR